MSVNCHLNAAGKPKQLTSASMFTKKKNLCFYYYQI